MGAAEADHRETPSHSLAVIIDLEVLNMAKSDPSKQSAFEQVLKLARELAPEEQDRLVEQMKLDWLKREVQIGLDQLANGDWVDGEEFLQELKLRAKQRSKDTQK
ncbi:MAG TPA: hypothetical protein V6C81_01135 [Planktothrix sp.]|jgi:hypothetical protein